jgi:hypothetical protein
MPSGICRDKTMQVVNKKTHRFTKNDTYIGRPSKYGNPFIIGKDGNRLEVIEKYRLWLKDRLREDPGFLNDLHDDSILVCWCAPYACHGDIIVRAYNYLRSHSLHQG